MTRDFDLQGVFVHVLATAMATGFYGAMFVALCKLATGA